MLQVSNGRAAQLRTIRGVHFIRVQGDAVERARMHAALLKERILSGAIPALAKKNEWIIRRSPGLTQVRPFQEAVIWFYNHLLMPHLARRMPREIRELMRAMAEESGLPLRTFQKSLFQADAFMLLCRVSVMKYTLGGRFMAAGLPGCTSAVALKDWTKSGRLLACRNQDYPMVGPWESNTTVIFNEPTEKGHIPHVSISTAGVHTAGLTALNREGITLFTHAHFGRNVTLRGMPVIDIGNEIVRRSRTLSEAIDIARHCRPYANWSFIVSSARENAAAVIEMTPNKTRVRSPQDGFLAHSNFFHSEELQKDEALMSGGYADDLEARICRIKEVIEENRGAVEPSHLALALGDQVDPFTGEERVVGNTVSVPTTIKSTVFDPLAQKLWVSCRQETPTGLGDFLEVDVDRFWDQSTSEEEWPSMPGYTPRNSRLTEGLRHYREAYRAFHMENHEPDYLERTLAALRKATRAYPEDGHLWVQAAILAFRCQQFGEAREYLERAKGLKLSRHIEGVRDLFLARCLDIEGKRQEAQSIYRQGIDTRDPMLRKAMRKGMRKPYRANYATSLLIDLQFPDTFHY